MNDMNDMPNTDNNYDRVPDRTGGEKQLPLAASLTLAAIACAVRIILSVLYSDMSTGEFLGNKAIVYVSGVLLVAALALAVFFAVRTYKGKLSCAGHLGGALPTFVFSMTGFFFVFSSLFIVYSMVTGAEFHKGATLISEIILLLFSLGTAVFFFAEASGKGEKLAKSPAYPLIYLFPVGWTLVRLFVMFTTFTARATYLPEKLQILSIAVLCIYFLYEARLIRAAKPEKCLLYSIMTELALALVPLSALPTLLFSLLYDTGAKIGEPLFCLVELSLCAVIYMRGNYILSDATDNGSFEI